MSEPKLYDDNPDEKLVLQGDIFTEIDFFITEIKLTETGNKVPDEFPNIVFRSSETGEKAQSLDSVESPIFTQFPEKRLVATISQTCDMQKEEYIVVSPIYTIKEYIKELELKNAKASKITGDPKLIRDRRKLDKFYLGTLQLPKRALLIDCFIDLKRVNTVSKGMLPPEKRIASLSHWGRQVLNFQLMWVYGRPVIDWKIPPEQD